MNVPVCIISERDGAVGVFDVLTFGLSTTAAFVDQPLHFATGGVVSMTAQKNYILNGCFR